MRVPIALAAALVAVLVQPTQVFAKPSVAFKAPADGSTVSGVIEGSECEAWASSDTATVDFYIDGRKINYNLSAPWNCSLDPSTLSTGWHTLWAVAGDDHGAYNYTSVQINISHDPGSAGPLSPEDSHAASSVSRSSWEPRPGNWSANHTRPTLDQLERFYAADSWGGCDWMRRRVTGNFTGTTDEIIQWAAHKWSLDADLLRAVAIQESWWNQTFRGDPDSGGSYGLMQVKSSVNRGTYPLSQNSTAFNVDYYAAGQRYYLDGCAADWMDRQYGNRRTYTPGDRWGSIGAWYSGAWYDRGAEEYISKIKHELWSRRMWERRSGF